MLSRLAPTAAVRSAISGTNATRFASAAAIGKKEKPATKEAQDSDSFCMNLFRGKAKVDQVFPYPLNLDQERKETLQMILDPITKFFKEVNDVVKNDENAETPMEILKKFAELGALGALVPPEYKGAGMNNTQMARLAEIVGSHDLGLSVTMGAHMSIGTKYILLVGTEEQKEKYLPDLATGRIFAAFCLTVPSSGSDASSIRSTARKSDDGSNGGFADVFTVFAQGSNTAMVNFENVKIPKENLLGGEGEGFKVAMNVLNNGRFGVPATTTGAMRYCIKKTYACESILYILASNMDRGIQDYQLEAAIAKVFTSHAGKHLQPQVSSGIGEMIGSVMGNFAGPSGAFNGVVDPAQECVSLFGRTVKDLLDKHKKGIINRQYEVVRVADAAIDIYGMAATLSRYCRPEIERRAAARAEANLKSVAANNEAIVNTIAEISKGSCSAGANPIAHPIDTL